MHAKRAAPAIAAMTFCLLGAAACSGKFLGGAAAGAGVAGGAYENKEALEDLEDDYKAGKIERKEYERRKDEIGDRSLIY